MRLDQLTCPICIESLFNKRDDLDEVYQTATPDCGHVFHESCLLDWFQTQAKQYIAQQREYHDISADEADAPAECPTCRKECFVDEDTGKPAIHRLYLGLDADGGGGAGPSSSVYQGSSPVSAKHGLGGKGKAKERERERDVGAELMGLARRARGIGEEVKELGVGSQEEGVEGSLRRAEGLAGDLKVNEKAIEGIRKYVGGLTAALNTLRTALQTNPLNEVYAARVQHFQTANTDLQRRMQELVQTHMPAEIQRAVDVELNRAERKVNKVREECELIKRELEREQVLRRTGRREMVERQEEAERKVKEAKEMLAKETADREVLQATLMERTKLLRVYQAKAESRKAMKSQVEDLEAENARLKSDLERQTAISRSARPVRRSYLEQRSPTSSGRGRISGDPMNFNMNNHEGGGGNADISIEEISAETFGSHHKHLGAGSDMGCSEDRDQEEDSLEVEFPTFADASRSGSDHRGGVLFALDGALSNGKKRPHPTSRVINSDTIATSMGVPSSKDRSHARSSKYFSGAGGMDKSRTNPFSSSRAETERKKTLPPPPAQSKTGQMECITVLDSPPVVADMARPPSDPCKVPRLDPFRHSPSRVNALPRASARSSAGKEGGGGNGLGRQRSMVEVLGLADKSGRPVKGLVSGAKIRKRA